MKRQFRTGIGYDIHPLVEGRDLFLGGVRIDSDLGAAGHSDADVLVHAVCDAILGALAMGDLGEHFPETEEFKDISSIILLERVGAMMADAGYRVGNIDCVVHAESPRLAPYRDAMRGRIAAAVGTSMEDISVKATRGEGLGPIGEKKGIAARAVVLLERTGERKR